MYSSFVPLRSWVYPRPCGGALPDPASADTRARSGLSPPVRGSRTFDAMTLSGKPTWVYPRPCGGAAARKCTLWLPVRAVYPRPCGGAKSCRSGFDQAPAVGLSPPVRGSLPLDSLTTNGSARGLSPPVRGSLPGAGRTGSGGGGLSPPVRGSRRLSTAQLFVLYKRSIPARAGEPMCGWHPHLAVRQRSIPARAGEPPCSWSTFRLVQR